MSCMSERPAMGLSVRPFAAVDEQAVIDVIVPIQSVEFGIAITANDQPDLREIPDFYQSGKGGFWVATAGDDIVGTLGLKDIGNGNAALRKMFVAADYRGREHGAALHLLEALFAHASAAGIRAVYLGTTDTFVAAHRFYEKNGFVEIGRDDLPAAFPLMAIDSKFYVRRVSA